jgi:hypothetical protein
LIARRKLMADQQPEGVTRREALEALGGAGLIAVAPLTGQGVEPKGQVKKPDKQKEVRTKIYGDFAPTIKIAFPDRDGQTLPLTSAVASNNSLVVSGIVFDDPNRTVTSVTGTLSASDGSSYQPVTSTFNPFYEYWDMTFTNVKPTGLNGPKYKLSVVDANNSSSTPVLAII